jgi:hypothetical protein
MSAGIIKVINIKVKELLADSFAELKLNGNKTDQVCNDNGENCGPKSFLKHIMFIHKAHNRKILHSTLI